MKGEDLSNGQFQREVIDRLARIETDLNLVRQWNLRQEEELRALAVAQASEAATHGRKAGAVTGAGMGAALVALIEGLKYLGTYVKLKAGG